MSEDLISREKAYKVLSEYYHHKTEMQHKALREALDRVPTAERKKGKWVYSEDEYGIDGYHCDKCGFFIPWDYVHKFINYIDDYNFCPNCGAGMKGENDVRHKEKGD